MVQKVLFLGYTENRQSRASQGIPGFECNPDLNHARFVLTHAAPGSEDAERLPVVAMQMPTEPTVSRFYAALLAHVGAPVPRAGPS